MRRIVVGVVVLLFVGCATAPARPRIVAPITDSCALIADGELSSCWSLVCERRAPRKLGCNHTALMQVAEASASPDGKWLAVISVGEGHPMLEVVDLPRFVGNRDYHVLKTINPYPGTVNLHGWAEGQLLIESDLPLTEDAKAGLKGEDPLLDTQQLFSIDLPSGEVRSSVH